MYEQLLDRYGVFFEGLPEPVFYGRHYPTGNPDDLRGMGLMDDFCYGWGLKEDRDPSGALLCEHREAYERELHQLLCTVAEKTVGIHRGVVVIPPSTAGKVSRVTEIVRRALARMPNLFDDLTDTVTRTRDKGAAHGGSRQRRSYHESYDTIGVAKDGQVERYGLILVIDDILTSGKSFRVMDDKLSDSGFAGTIVNFAFLRTCRGEAVLPCLDLRRPDSELAQAQRQRKAQNATKRIEGLVLDLGQTLLDDSPHDIPFEEQFLTRDHPPVDVPYSPYRGIERLTNLGIPYAIISDRPPTQQMKLYSVERVRAALLPHCEKVPPLPSNVFTFPIEERDDFTVRHYRPSPRGVLEALSYLREQLSSGGEHARIIGLGNTFDDIVAYEAAGIESALALWGIPDTLRDGARKSWCADHVFETIEAFAAWVKESGRGSKASRIST